MKKRKMTRLMALPLAAAIAATIVPGAAMVGFAQNSTGSFYPTHASVEEALQAARDLNVQIAEEGVILLKNGNNALPVSKKSSVSVFGYSSESIQGVAGNSSMATALADKGFRVNPILKDFYAGMKYNANTQGRGETIDFTPAVERSIDEYGDVAFVTVTRFLSEGTFAGDHNTVLNGKAAGVEKNSALDKQVIDEEAENVGGWKHKALYSETVEGQKETYKHELMLANQEVALLNYVKNLKKEGRVKKIIYLMNAVVPLEMYNLENDEDVDGILMISRPGTTGLEGVANVIAGDANPSGKTNQIYVKDYTADPVWYNVGLNNQVNADQASITYDASGKVVTEGDSLNANSVLSKITYNYLDAEGKKQTTRGAAYMTPTSGWRPAAYTKNADGLFGIDYEEDIYRDYWYYETKAADMNKKEAGTGTAWYKDAVVYPFGYGLSYGAKFQYEITGVKLNDNSTLADNSTLDTTKLASASGKKAEISSGVVSVKVTNIGNAEGKEAVQLYSTAPYTGKAEKPHVKLLGFEKTGELKPGASETVKISFDFQDMASYDWRGLTGDKGYVLELGEYALQAMGSSNSWMEANVTATNDDYDVVNFTLGSNAYLKLDDFSGNEISNLFSPENGVFSSVRGVEGNSYQFNASASAHQTFLSRADGFTTSFPQAPTADDMTISMETLNRLSYWDKFQIGAGIVSFDEPMYIEELSGTGYKAPLTNPTPADFAGIRYQDGQDVWSKDGKIVAAGTAGATKIVDGAKDFPWIADFKANKAQMADWNQAKAGTTTAAAIQLSQMSAYAPFSTETISKDSEKTQAEAWTEFMNQLTYAEMEQISLRGQGSDIQRIGMGKLSGGGDSNSVGGYKWASNGMLASTYNKDLAKKQGQIIGDLFMLNTNNNAWWGGASQCIRTVWAGRNGEFHSTDPILTGFMASTLTKEVASKGVAVCIKHGILNDQQFPNVSPMTTWISEQAIREIYAKPFQMSIQQGKANYFMGSYARIGTMYNGVNYNFVTGLIRGEWGAKDIMYTTDNHAQVGKSTAGDMMARAGLSDMNTGNSKGLSGNWEDGEGTANGKVVYSMADKFAAPAAGNNLLSAEEEGQLQYFLARRNATIFINGHSKTLMNKNGVDFTAWKTAQDTTIELTQGTAASEKTVAGTIANAETVKYITDKLPEGLTLNEDGSISGTPVAVGSTEITVTAVVDGWIKDTKKYTINVATGFTVHAEAATAGTEYSAAVVFNGATAYSATGLPAGLKIEANGDIIGTPTTPGTYSVTVTATTRNATFEHTFDLTVGGTAVADGAVVGVEIAEGKVLVTYENGVVAQFDRIAGADGAAGANGADGSKILFGTKAPEATAGKDGDVYLDTTTYTVYNKANGAWTSLGSIKGADGAQGPQGPEGPQGPAGEAAKGGCGSYIESTATIAITLGMAALAMVAVALLHRKKN